MSLSQTTSPTYSDRDGLSILTDHSDTKAMAPSTIDNKTAGNIAGDEASVLKGDVYGDDRLLDEEGHVFLVPTPTDDPADPLNWHPLRKWAILVLLLIWSATALSTQNFLANFEPSLVERFPDATTSQINLLLTVITPMIAPGQLIFTPLAITYGRRLSLLLANALLVGSCVWGACSTSYNSLLGARIVEGLAGGPTDAMAFTIIQEFTFVHERGAMLGVMMMGQLALQLIFSIGTNYMAVTEGFKWPFVMFACIAAFTLVGLFLIMPESRYYRSPDAAHSRLTKEQYREFRRNLNQSGEYEPYTLRRQLQIWVGRGKGENSSITHFVKTMGVQLLSPVVWWNSCLNAVSTGSLIAASTLYASILVSPPWSWPSENVGLINIAPAITALFNWILLGWGNDKLLIWKAKRNHGISKPEHRLIMLVIPVVIGFAACIGFGGLAQNYLVTNPGGSQPHWFSMVVIIGLFYMSFGGVLEVTYTYMANVTAAEDSLAAMTVVSVIRDLVSFGMSYGVVGFATNCGYLTSFSVYGLLTAVFGFGAIPVYMYAGKLRSKTGIAI